METLQWRDLSANEVYHIAHIENEARDAASKEIGKLAFQDNPLEHAEIGLYPKAEAILENSEDVTRKWLEDQAISRDITAKDYSKETARKTISTDDKEWLEQLGRKWPDDTEESQWLNDVNELVKIGSTDLREYPKDEEVKTTVLQSREEFFDLFPTLAPVVARLKNTKVPKLSSPSKLISTARILRSKGIDVGNAFSRTNQLLTKEPMSVARQLAGLESMGLDVQKVVRTYPGILNYKSETVKERMEAMNSMGLDAVKVVNNSSTLLTGKSELVRKKLRTLKAIGRMWDIDEQEVFDAVQDTPKLIGISSKKIKTIARVLNGTVETKQPIKSSVALNLVIHPLERIVVAYLREGEEIDSPQSLIKYAKAYGRQETKESLRKIIEEADRSDPVVKSYFRAYPSPR